MSRNPAPIHVTPEVATILCDCARQLLRAYRRGCLNGGSIDWNDVDEAARYAERAVRIGKREARKRPGHAVDGPAGLSPYRT